MTVLETATIMDILTAAYPQFYRNASDKSNALQLWASMFEDDNLMLVANAVKAIVVGEDSGFPPTIGQVKAKMRKMMEPNSLTEFEAWGLIKKAIANGTYGAKEEFEKLPPVLQSLVGESKRLMEWAQMDADTIESVVASNLMRSYKVREKEQKDYAALPSSIKSFIGSIAERIGLPRGDQHDV